MTSWLAQVMVATGGADGLGWANLLLVWCSGCSLPGMRQAQTPLQPSVLSSWCILKPHLPWGSR